MDRVTKLGIVDQVMVSPFKDQIELEASVDAGEVELWVSDYLVTEFSIGGFSADAILAMSSDVTEAITAHWKLNNIEKGDCIEVDGRIWNCKEAQEQLEGYALDHEDPYAEITRENCEGLV